MTFEARAELPEREELLVVDRTGRAEHRVHERRRVSLREDEMVVREIVGMREVVAEMTGEDHRHEVRRREGRRGVP